MRQIAAALAASAVAGLVLGACGSSGASYADGYGVGQAYAASIASFTADPAVPHAACLKQYRVAAPTSDSKSLWLRGCETAFRQVAASMGERIPSH